VLSCAAARHSKLKYLRMLYHAGVHPPFGFLPSTKASERKLLLRRLRAHCTNCELCAGNRCLVCTLAFIGILLLSSPLSLCSSVSCVPWWVLALITDARAHCDNCEQCACSRGLIYALSYVGCLLALCAHLWFPAFCINPAEHLEVRLRTVVCQRFAH